MRQASFIKSAIWPKDYPDAEGRLEIAIAGRSNVGKSSLINTLVNQRQLARVSNTPGRTQLLNFFLVDHRFILCDLPGFGYAKVPLKMKKTWGKMMESYLTTRSPLRALLILTDARREPGEWEQSLVELGSRCGWGVIPVITKIDKLNKSQQHLTRTNHARTLGFAPEKMICWSAVTRAGFDELWAAIDRSIGMNHLAQGQLSVNDTDQSIHDEIPDDLISPAEAATEVDRIKKLSPRQRKLHKATSGPKVRRRTVERDMIRAQRKKRK